MGLKKKVVHEPDPPKPLFRPRTYADLDDDFEIPFEGVKIIREQMPATAAKSGGAGWRSATSSA
jgi:hypothetical protein